MFCLLERSMLIQQELFGPAGLTFMKMQARLDTNGDHIKMSFGHGADHENGKIDKDWDFHSDIPNRMAGGFD
eukprot:CAMPEP_0173380300 /NCGR_PEP_ID=MMETSP1356-20130122/3012_1 /TAXON_ID=77927 ORGANISM="Hemiselmis virescens, Strain PCC157" /NCGR_SAMPLE_ID=MMETSP1356 /ASSEMBLY_ACC=CAM_ASM_000847 /LENGTH=71 /DNA_ID=CAMNT_0014333841 /DNA_START=18 /DNA_END=233 /DNA_ORIENTATION=+